MERPVLQPFQSDVFRSYPATSVSLRVAFLQLHFTYPSWVELRLPGGNTAPLTASLGRLLGDRPFATPFALFDARADPMEQQDIAAQKPDVVACMRRELAQWLERQNPVWRKWVE